MIITDDILYVGVNDRKIDLFEGQYTVLSGMAYNSYVILDDKIAVMDTVETSFGEEWLENLRAVLQGRTVDYLVVHHMEPDHSANILCFSKAYPDAKIVSSNQSFRMMENFYGTDFSDRRVVVEEGSVLSLGNHKLRFFAAPMVHWPEVMVSYDERDKVLFSADGFGKFGTYDAEEDWVSEARRYYVGIVGKYGSQVQKLLKKVSFLEIDAICPLHGPVLKENLSYYIGLYDAWSSYRPEEEGVAIFYTSVYGNTKKAVLQLKEELENLSCPKVVIRDLTRCDMAEAVADAFRFPVCVFATTTYNGGIFPPMNAFIGHLKERNFAGRTVAFVENGSWAPTAARVMKGMLEPCRDLSYAKHGVSLLSAMKEKDEEDIKALAQELCGVFAVEDNKTKTKEKINMKKYVCGVCGWTYNEAEGDPDNGIAPGTKFEDLPEDFVCPLCGVDKDNFSEE